MKILSIALFAVMLAAAAGPDLRISFMNPPDDCRIMMRWWWFGPAVTREELEREMKLMKDGGIGGFEVQPVYPLALDDAEAGIRNLPYLSDEFLDALRFTSEKAHELGLRMDLTLGSGWPYGGPLVSVRDAAGKLRIVRNSLPDNTRRMPVPDIGAGEKLVGAFLRAGSDIRELEEIKDGAIVLPEGLQGKQEVIFFISSRTGMMVKRPAVGAEGFVLNHYDRAAVEAYLTNVGDRLMKALRSHPPHAVFCDSLEVFESDWTSDFLEEFRKRRGYDLKPHLPALVLDLGEMTPAIRCDWGRTLTELFNDRFMVPVHEWSRSNRTLFRVQGYGVPPATLASNAHADISEGEGFRWKTVSASRWAASANHLFGRIVTASETWTWLHSPVFRATPLDLKAEANLHFLQGVNQLIGHGWPYSAESAEYPGWRFYAAGVFNEKNPWWIVMPDVARYLQRTSYVLRQGQPVSDVAVYLPVSDAYAGFTPGNANLIDSLRTRVGPHAVGAVLDAGCSIDFFDDDILRQIGKVESGALVLGSNRYRAVILPNVERIPLESYRVLAEFVQKGGVLIASGRQPAAAPGFGAMESENAEIRDISRSLFSSSSGKSRYVEDEKKQLSAVLRSILQPDVRLMPETPDIGFVHRRAGDAEIYFLANTSNTRHVASASFRVSGMQAELWDPMSGQIIPAAVSADGEGMTSVELDLDPYAARFLVFSARASHRADAGKKHEISKLDLSESWQVAFGETGLLKSMQSLSSWTDDETTRYFSGVAVYRKNIAVPDNMLQQNITLQLDFGAGQPLPELPEKLNGMQAWHDGPVREAAVVYINDRRAGSVWCPPYLIDLTGLLKRGENQIKILVANTAVNHMAGRSLPDYRLLNLRYGKRFDPQDMNRIRPIVSGLLSPLTLKALTGSDHDKAFR
ncbi:MAG: glycoside hydrolase [Acidobacteria bacterium]|nr:glycoside hydrolase [Acidobacteriota bacterium]